ncbi:MAG: hypothetical protein E7601_03885 [Ruminococcaceae bacterium]|nr:hypothetical protein [Oscillospiraceae bacterium]
MNGNGIYGNRKKKKSVLPLLICLSALLLALVIILFVFVICDLADKKYEKALACIEKKEYGEAYFLFRELGIYKDSEEYLGRFSVWRSKWVVKNENGQIINTYAHEYDDHSKIRLLTETDANGKVRKTEYLREYDAEGKEIRTVERVDGEVIRITVYKYGKDGKLISDRVTDADGFLTNETKYNSNGDYVNFLSYENGEVVLEMNCEYKYNEKGDTVEVLVERKGKNESESVYLYEYDKRGNMVKRTSNHIYYNYRGQGRKEQTEVMEIRYDAYGIVKSAKITDSLYGVTYEEYKEYYYYFE